MNNNDERDYAEEEYNRRFMEEEGKSELEGDIREAFKEGKNIQRVFYTSYPAFNMTWLIDESHVKYDPNGSAHIAHAVPDREGNAVFVWPEVHFTADSATDRIRKLMTVSSRFYYSVVHKLDNEHNNW